MSYQWPQDREDREDDYQPLDRDRADHEGYYDSNDNYITPGRAQEFPSHRGVSMDSPRNSPRGRADSRDREMRSDSRDRDMNRDDRSDSRGRDMNRDDRSDSRGRRNEEHKRYDDERDVSPISALDSIHSDPPRQRRGSSPTRGRATSESPRYTTRRRRKLSNASDTSDTSLRSAGSFDLATGRPRRRRLSMAEGRALRRAVEKAEEEASEIMKRRRTEEKRRRAKYNRNRVRNMDNKPLDSDEEVTPSDLRVGDVVLVNRGVGVVRFVGKLHFNADHEADVWVGVELKEPKGTNNGCLRGKQYFNCRERHGIFVNEVTKRLSPEDLLDQLALSRHKSKELKAKVDQKIREKFENEMLRDQVATMTAQIGSLKKNHVSDIANAVDHRMENFLSVLADSLNPEDQYATPGGGNPNALTLSKGNLPASSVSDNHILRWLSHKKKQQRRKNDQDPIIMDEKVQGALIWCIRSLQKEVACRNGYASDESE